MQRLNSFSNITTGLLLDVDRQYGSPVYIYDESTIIQKCKMVLSMPNAYGLHVRYAMKANSNQTLLRLIEAQGIGIDASSLMEARRAYRAGIAYEKIILTSQEVQEGNAKEELEHMMLQGLTYNVCSLRQLEMVAKFAATHKIPLSMRVHPGVGSGESASRNTGDAYSCFGIHLNDLQSALDIAKQHGVTIGQVHVHIGSGADPAAWRSNIDLELGIVEKYFPDATTVSFGGGLKEARMPEETAADIEQLGLYAKEQMEAFYKRTGRKLKMEIEPGTYLMANAGYILTKVMDKKSTGEQGFEFLIVNGGMELNTRPLMYGSQHPFYIISQTGQLLSSEFDAQSLKETQAIIVGRCCETGDSQCIDSDGYNAPRPMATPEVGDYVVIGGAGAYCSSMAPFNYNSHLQAPEILVRQDGRQQLIRKGQTLEQLLENEQVI
ncbi:diaminopimelate decarboxylase [Clostridia bacterium OttesenSCG-928-F22]|nr:diaminopimelate decarboxylase [Clostridia bacterium OttesenSCG-928-F22]